MPRPTPIPREQRGRSLRWRLGMLLGGAFLAAAGGAIVLWPQSLSFIAGGALGLAGAFLVVSAVAAKGR